MNIGLNPGPRARTVKPAVNELSFNHVSYGSGLGYPGVKVQGECLLLILLLLFICFCFALASVIDRGRNGIYPERLLMLLMRIGTTSLILSSHVNSSTCIQPQLESN